MWMLTLLLLHYCYWYIGLISIPKYLYILSIFKGLREILLITIKLYGLQSTDFLRVIIMIRVALFAGLISRPHSLSPCKT